MFAQKVHQEVGFNILKQRKLKKLTQIQVADAAGISRSRLSSIEGGTVTFTLVTLLKIAKAIDVDYRLLLDTNATVEDINIDEN